MSIGDYQLLTQLGVGTDGVAYRARHVDTNVSAEVRILNNAQVKPLRWPSLQKRLRRVVLLEHPCAIQIREFDLENEPPFVVLDVNVAPSLSSMWQDCVPMAMCDCIDIVMDVGDVLAAAHRLGIVHGRLCPASIFLGEERKITIDLTGIDTGPIGDDDSIELTAEDDVLDFGRLLQWLFLGEGAHEDAELIRPLVDEILHDDPAKRLSIHEVRERLIAETSCLFSRTITAPPVVDGETSREEQGRLLLKERLSQASVDPAQRTQLGRFQLSEKLGEGGMGAVYRAVDRADGTIVAVKILRTDLALQSTALARFHKEARLLAEVNNPYVTRLLEVNEDAGVHFLAMEFVDGKNMREVLGERERLDEAEALAIMSDVCRALLDAHKRGIVHRDIKPDNILLGGNAVKLSDFGMARHLVQSESLNVTQTGAVLGTPLYMSPEQCKDSGSVDARSDVYSMGATLFHLLAGRPPFVGKSPLSVIAMHCNDPPPPLQTFSAEVSDAVAQMIEKSLAKDPDQRYTDAEDLLRDLDRCLRGEPSNIVIHPRLPECDPSRVVHYDWSWELESSPAQLWPLVSNTERVNRAVHLPSVEFTTETGDDGNVKRYGRFRKMGLTAAWQEHPFEWIEGQRFGVLREYNSGPFRWLVSMCEFKPRANGGTTLAHRVWLEPTGFVGRTIAAIEVGVKGHRAVDRLYRRFDASLCGRLSETAGSDPFEKPAKLSRSQNQRLHQTLDGLAACGVEPVVIEKLGEFLSHASPQDVARIRPLAFARRFRLDEQQVISACIHGAHEGLLELLWDILCPICRISSGITQTLRELKQHGHCPACNLDFELDFGNSIEVIFRAHPEIRQVETETYCIGGPAHSPHVAAQVRVAPDERLELELKLAAGEYCLRGPQLPYSVRFHVQHNAPSSHWELQLCNRPNVHSPVVLQTSRQFFILTNDSSREILVRVERTTQRADALTAARVSTLTSFRELFPGEVLSPGQLVSVANMTFLVTELVEADHIYESLGDGPAFRVLHEHFRVLDERIRSECGTVIRNLCDGILAAFHAPAAAVRAGLDLQSTLERNPIACELKLRIGIHRGTVHVANVNDRLDYFGRTIKQTLALPQYANENEIILTQSISEDPSVAATISDSGFESRVLSDHLPGMPKMLMQRVVKSIRNRDEDSVLRLN